MKDENINNLLIVFNALFNFGILYVNFLTDVNLEQFPFELFIIWILVIISLSKPFNAIFSELIKTQNIDNISNMSILLILLGFSNYNFIKIGLFMGYNWAIACIVIIILMSFFFIYIKFMDKRLLFKSMKVNYLIIISFFICILFPSIFVVVDPIFQEPKIIVSISEPEILIVTAGDFIGANIVVDNARGHAWDFILSTNSDHNLYIFIDGVENGEKTISYLSSNTRKEFPIKIDTSYSIGNGTYRLELIYEYKNAQYVKTNEKKVIPIYIGSVEHAAFPYIWVDFIIIIIVVVLLYYFRKRNVI